MNVCHWEELTAHSILTVWTQMGPTCAIVYLGFSLMESIAIVCGKIERNRAEGRQRIIQTILTILY